MVALVKLLNAMVYFPIVRLFALVMVLAHNQKLVFAMQIGKATSVMSHNALVFLRTILHKFALVEVHAHNLILVFANQTMQVQSAKHHTVTEFLQIHHPFAVV